MPDAPAPTSFTEEEQAAVLGHVLRNAQLWVTLDAFGVSDKWFEKNAHGTVMVHLNKFRTVHGRPPRGANEFYALLQETPDQKKWLKEEIGKCLATAKDVGWDLLEVRLTDWARFQVMAKYTKAKVDKVNDRKVGEGVDLALEEARELQRLDRVGGRVDAFEPSPAQLEKILKRLDQQAPDLLEYGITALDELTGGGIGRNDLHILTAYTGIGKTELARQVAQHNAEKGKKVAAFFLEAEPQEAEQRILFPLFKKWYQADNPAAQPTTINYEDFSRGRLNILLKQYDARARAYWKDHLSTLQTYYREAKDFTVDTLEAKILEINAWADLMILDHLHYIDTPGKDENREMQDIIKKLRNLSIHTGLPMLVIAHVRKRQGGQREKALLPHTDDLQGAGAIGKMATGIIVIGQCDSLASCDSRAAGSGTLIRATKYRRAGARTKHTICAFWDSNTHEYSDHYAVGKMKAGDTKWVPLKESRPFWAKHGDIEDVSDGDA